VPSLKLAAWEPTEPVSAGPVTNMKMPVSIESPAATRPGHDFTSLLVIKCWVQVQKKYAYNL